MIIGARNWQDTGKTAWAVGFIKRVLEIGAKYDNGFRPSDVVANVHLEITGTICLTNREIRYYIGMMVKRKVRHKIVFVDEADRVFPARFWQDKEQTEALIGLWQDEKMFNIIVYTAHKGTSVDLVLRQTTQIEIEPLYSPFDDFIAFRVYDALHGHVYEDCYYDVSVNIFPFYDRWEISGSELAKAGGYNQEHERTDFGGLSSRDAYTGAVGGVAEATPPRDANDL